MLEERRLFLTYVNVGLVTCLTAFKFTFVILLYELGYLVVYLVLCKLFTMETKKRERSANFNSAEVQLLVSLVEKHKQIIENKKTDAITNKDKEYAWKKIENSFNSSGISSIERSWKTLKLKYEGVKKGTKKKSSIQRQEMYRTGGGPSNAPEFTDVEAKVMSICSNIKGLDARHDSDTVKSVPISISDMVIMDVDELRSADSEIHNTEDIVHFDIPDMNAYTLEEQTDEIKIIDNQTHKDMNEAFTAEQKNFCNKNDNLPQKENRWDKWHPKALKSRVSNALKPDIASKTSVTSKLDQLSSARLELVQIQMEIARKEQLYKEEEHKLKMQHLANDEKRKQEIHALLIQKLNCAPLSDDTICKHL